MQRQLPLNAVEGAEATGVAGYVAIAIIGLVVGTALLDNVFPLGTSGQLLSGGMVPLLNLTVGLEVGAGIVLVAIEFLDDMVRVPQRPVIR